MKKGNIVIPINEVWELLNKPHRFFSDLHDKVDKLELGKYEYLDFDEETKIELLERIKKIANKGILN